MKCQWQTGLLSPEPCGTLAMGSCGTCGQAICMAHTSMGQGGIACPQCASSQDGYQQNEETELAGARSGYFQQYGKPGYFTKNDESSLNNKKPKKDDDFET